MPKVVKQLAELGGDSGFNVPEVFALCEVEHKQRTKREAKAERTRKQREEVAEASRKREVAKRLNDWLRGEHVNTGGLFTLPPRLRVVGDQVQTSHGASVSIEAAKVLFDAIQSGQPLPSDIDGYQVIGVNEGRLQVGCHNIPMGDVHRIANALGLTQTGKPQAASEHAA